MIARQLRCRQRESSVVRKSTARGRFGLDPAATSAENGSGRRSMKRIFPILALLAAVILGVSWYVHRARTRALNSGDVFVREQPAGSPEPAGSPAPAAPASTPASQPAPASANGAEPPSAGQPPAAAEAV